VLKEADVAVLTAALFPPEAPELSEGDVLLNANAPPAKLLAVMVPPVILEGSDEGAPVPPVKFQTT
jgi:hypothetical protein